jgi:hypothetical protein
MLIEPTQRATVSFLVSVVIPSTSFRRKVEIPPAQRFPAYSVQGRCRMHAAVTPPGTNSPARRLIRPPIGD